jgi:uncharacterized protein GlcG (DUF336 family)
MSIIVEKPTISAAAGLQLVRWALAHAETQGWTVCAAVCDPAGHLVAFHRHDGVNVPPIEFAIDKAYTAATMGRTTAALFARAEEKPPLKLGLANRRRLLVFPGGVPIMHESRVIGGLGVSGAADHEDVLCAEAALAQLAHN